MLNKESWEKRMRSFSTMLRMQEVWIRKLILLSFHLNRKPTSKEKVPSKAHQGAGDNFYMRLFWSCKQSRILFIQ